jgi:hypothetical protein
LHLFKLIFLLSYSYRLMTTLIPNFLVKQGSKSTDFDMAADSEC